MYVPRSEHQMEMGRGYTMVKSAELSECGRYRYRLARMWDPNSRVLTCVLLNPSTADADRDDPTLRRLMHFARSWGYGGIYLLNLFAYRATHPDVLKKLSLDEAEGPKSGAIIRAALDIASFNKLPVFAGYGNGGAIHSAHSRFVRLARTCGTNLICLGLSNGQFPTHPLARGIHRVPDNATPRSYTTQVPPGAVNIVMFGSARKEA